MKSRNSFLFGAVFLCAIFLLTLWLSGCGTVYVEPPVDAACPLPPMELDAGPAPPPSGLTGRVVCGVTDGIFTRRALEGSLTTADGSACPPPTCPFPFDRTGRISIVCDPIAVEACIWALESSANDCDGFTAALAACEASSCR